MNTKTIAACVFAFLACLFSARQVIAANKTDTIPYKGVVKLNLLALPLKTLSLQGEFGFAKHWSTCLGGAYMPKRDLPFGAGEKIEPYFINTRFHAFLITPELRWYPLKKQSATNGFYLAGYLRYKHTQLQTSFSFSDSTRQYIFPITYSSNAIALGGMLGYQFKVHRFSLDLWIAGAHMGYQESSVNVDITGLAEVLEEPEIKKQMDRAFHGNNVPNWLKREVTNYLSQQDISLSWSQPYAGLRTGLTIGFRF